MAMGLKPLEISDRDYLALRDMLRDTCGLDIGTSKQEMIQSRLRRRLAALGFSRIRDYLAYVEKDVSGQEFWRMVDVLTTNLTFFFREPDHFKYLQRLLAGKVLSGRAKFRGWSAGCSSGEEAYSMAMIVYEALALTRWQDALILGTDISERVLETARAGLYPGHQMRAIPPQWKLKYFTREKKDAVDLYRVKPEVSGIVRFCRHNLSDFWPMKGPFDVIFCRNVLIYFDKDARVDLVERFSQVLAKDGVLALGHSEGLLGAGAGLRHIAPGLYQKS